jgi:hypothetical protein
VSQVAGDEAKLIKATDTTRARQQPQNRRETMANGDGVPWVCAWCEASAEGCECVSEGRGGRVGTGQLEKGQGGDGRGLNVRRGRGVHSDARVVRERFGEDESDRRDHGSARAGERTGGQADERTP